MIECSVSGCGRTTSKPNLSGWICPAHWARIPTSRRRVWARIKRTAAKYGWAAMPYDRYHRLWVSLVSDAAHD